MQLSRVKETELVKDCNYLRHLYFQLWCVLKKKMEDQYR